MGWECFLIVPGCEVLFVVDVVALVFGCLAICTAVGVAVWFGFCFVTCAFRLAGLTFGVV